MRVISTSVPLSVLFIACSKMESFIVSSKHIFIYREWDQSFILAVAWNWTVTVVPAWISVPAAML